MQMLATTPELPLRSPLSSRLSCEIEPKRRRYSLSMKPISPTIIASESYLYTNFTFLRRLGSGAFGDVDAFRHNSTGDECAVKTFKTDPLKNRRPEKYCQKNLREVERHKMILPHANIVAFERAWKENLQLMMQIELCSGCLEGHWKKTVTLAVTELKRILVHILKALHHLHTQQMLHLDVKPDNIMRTAGGVYKLGDFSTMFIIGKDEQKEEPEFGDRRFAAPELLKAQYSEKADIYSLGITIAQVAAPANSPISDEEWKKMREKEKVPVRVGKGMTGIKTAIEAMISVDTNCRPDVLTLIGAMEGGGEVGVLRALNKIPPSYSNYSAHHRLSLPAHAHLREQFSPRFEIAKKVTFDDDANFFLMGSSNSFRHSLGGLSKPHKPNFDDDV